MTPILAQSSDENLTPAVVKEALRQANVTQAQTPVQAQTQVPAQARAQISTQVQTSVQAQASSQTQTTEQNASSVPVPPVRPPHVPVASEEA